MAIPIFGGNGLLALGVEHALLRAGCKVPGDVAIVGYDDVPFAAMAFVSVTSIRRPRFDLGRQAAKRLLDEASGVSHRHQQ